MLQYDYDLTRRRTHDAPVVAKRLRGFLSVR
jgi:hypothetical protein